MNDEFYSLHSIIEAAMLGKMDTYWQMKDLLDGISNEENQ